jgi:hypothetical protein
MGTTKESDCALLCVEFLVGMWDIDRGGTCGTWSFKYYFYLIYTIFDVAKFD